MKVKLTESHGFWIFTTLTVFTIVGMWFFFKHKWL